MKFSDVIQSADWKAEKHVPVINAPETITAGEKFTLSVSVGEEIPHPDTVEHHIRWIQLFFKPADGKFAFDIGKFEFNAHGEGPVVGDPVAVTKIKLQTGGSIIASAYCNIHGLWENDREIKVV
ncbi:MAG: class II SORL domain-containing protein [Bacillota bacterium]